MDRNELLGNMKKIYRCRQMNAEHCFDGCSVCDFYCPTAKRDATFKAIIDMLEGKDTNVPTKWIPVTPDTMPEENKVVVVCGEKGTWDYGTYRGHLNSINNWNWKKNTVKTVYWWMYKEDALPMPWKGEQHDLMD